MVRSGWKNEWEGVIKILMIIGISERGVVKEIILVKRKEKGVNR